MNEVNSLAFLCHPYHRGGVTSWMASAAKESSKQGIKTYFITVDPQSPFISSGNKPTMIELLGELTSNLQIISSKVGFEFELGTNDYRSIIYARLILANIPKGIPIIVSDDYAVWQAAALIANEYRMIGVLHSDDKAYYDLSKDFRNYVGTFTAVSERIKLKANILDKNVTVIPCGIDTLELLNKPNSLNNETDLIKIVWIGRIDEKQKRVSDISQIAKFLRDRKVSFNISVLGNGPQFENLKEDISKLALENQIELLGWQSSDKIKEILHKSDILLQTSNFEGMSVAVMEALAAGCGVVSSRVSGVEDYEDSIYSLSCLRLYEIGNIEEAGVKIIELSQIDKVEKKNVAIRFAETEFSIKTCMHRYLSVTSSCAPSKNKLQLPSSELWISLKSRTLALVRYIKYQLNK